MIRPEDEHSTTNNDQALLELSSIQLQFGDIFVLHQLDLAVYRGETLSLVGNSGTGKSLLVKMLIGLVKPTKGEIRLAQQPVVGLDEIAWMPWRQKISMLFQANALFDSMSVYENIAYPLREHFDYHEKEIEARIEQVLSWVLLPGIQGQFPSELSGGQRKRVSLARAIITQPEVLLYDEPTAGLDPVSTTVIDDMIKRFQREQGVTSIVITHDLKSALSVADRVALLHNGRIHKVAAPEQMLQSEDPIVYQFFEGYRMTQSLLEAS